MHDNPKYVSIQTLKDKIVSPALNTSSFSGFLTNACDILTSDDVLSVIMACSFSLSDEKLMLFCPLHIYFQVTMNSSFGVFYLLMQSISEIIIHNLKRNIKYSQITMTK